MEWIVQVHNFKHLTGLPSYLLDSRDKLDRRFATLRGWVNASIATCKAVDEMIARKRRTDNSVLALTPGGNLVAERVRLADQLKRDHDREKSRADRAETALRNLTEEKEIRDLAMWVLKRDLAAMGEENERLKHHVAAREEETETLKDQLEGLEEQTYRLEEEGKRLKQDLAAREGECKRLRQGLAVWEDECETLKQDLAEKEDVCQGCGEKPPYVASNLTPCPGCRKAYFCSPNCENAHFDRHQKGRSYFRNEFTRITGQSDSEE